MSGQAAYNFAYLDEQTKRMLRRALLKAVAIPGYQVPFASREMPLAYGWGTGGMQVTAADGSPVALRFNLPLSLRCRVLCSSLVGSDVGDPRVSSIIAALDTAGARRSALFPTLGGLIGTQPPARIRPP